MILALCGLLASGFLYEWHGERKAKKRMRRHQQRVHQFIKPDGSMTFREYLLSWEDK